MKSIFKKEINYYLNNPIGYIVIFLFSSFVNFFYINYIYNSSISSVKPLFNYLPWSSLIFIPVLSMRILSEEKRLNTIEVLLTLPVSEKAVVIGKFFALLFLYLISLFLTSFFVIFLFIFSKLSLTEVLTGYLGQILSGGFLISLSIFISGKTKNQLISFFVSLIFIFVIFVIGTDFMGLILPRIIIDNLVYFSPIYHLQSFSKGVIDLRSVFYYLSFTFLFISFSIIDLKKRQ